MIKKKSKDEKVKNRLREQIEYRRVELGVKGMVTDAPDKILFKEGEMA